MTDDEAREKIRQEIWDAYGLDDMTDAERADFEAYGRAVEQKRREEAEFAAAMNRSAVRIAARMSRLLGVEGRYE